MDRDHRRIVSVGGGALTWVMGLTAGAMLMSSAFAAVDPDTDFGNGFVDEEGSFAETFGGTSGDFVDFYDAERLDNGKLVAAGSTWNGSDHDFLVARLNADGTLDPTFDGNGYRLVGFDKGGGNDDFGFAVTVLNDGRIAVAGSVSLDSTPEDFGVVLLDSNGSNPVTNTIAFGSDREDQPKDIAADDNGICVVGESGVGKAALARVDPENSLALDTTFISDGKGLEDNAKGEAIALRDNGKIVLTGPIDLYGSTDPDPGVIQLNADGSKDTSFGGGDGLLNFDDVDDSDAQPRTLAIDGSGRPVVGGYFIDNQDGEEKAFVVRVQKDGSALDDNFGNVDDDTPSAIFNSSVGPGLFDGIFDIAFDAQGRILFSGLTETGAPTKEKAPSDVFFGRLDPDGIPDTDFSSNGYTTLSFVDDFEYARAIVPAGQDRFVAVGGFDNGSGTADYETDTAFAIAGEVTTSSDGSDGSGGGGLVGPMTALGLALIGAARTRRIISLLS